jgi:hypothetical protein
MNRTQARQLVTETFTHAFDKTHFRNFILNVLNRFDESKAQQWNTAYIKDAFKSHVHRYERLGTYTSPDKETLDVLVVYLTTESKLERARTSIRNFVADHLKNRDEKDAALVAFVSPSEDTWRFSYVKMEYASVVKESGKVGIETKLTPARRFSYIVGEGESCHTAQARFLNLLGDTRTDPLLASIEDAFSVEAVTKEFFTKYADLFGQINSALESLATANKAIREEFASKGVNTVDFAKKLMGQIVFLYFLQKKGWLGVAKGKDWGTGPHDFLRRMANGGFGEYGNFFNDILEPLFYDTLATDRGHEAWCDRFQCRIPFLNGGLFEPLVDYNWSKIDVPLPNSLFANADYVDEGVTGTGVLDVFDRYNFTVNEAEPLEKEVAIDPEMLGKVFENLIEDNRRKGLGAYYTPREIVHYMCQESLINYLDTTLNSDGDVVPRSDIETFIHLGEQYSFYEAAKQAGTVGSDYPAPPKAIEQNARLLDEKLADITVCDPAVGSGAFPVGMMTEIVRSRCTLTPYFNDVHERTPYHFKRHAIQNCLYGVDVDDGAVEIAKLRLWLSLVVDEEEAKQIKPLPNLDFKIVSGNSLIGFPFKSKGLHEIEKLKAQFFEETDHNRKSKLKVDIENKLHDCFASSKQSLGFEVNFDFEVDFSEVFRNKRGFDVVIANPPYLGEKGHKEVFRGIAGSPLGKRFYQGKMDLFYFFFHLALDLTSSTGTAALITTNYYGTATGATSLRSDLKVRSVVRSMVNFNEVHIFESALGQHNMITVLQKGSNPELEAKTCITRRRGFADAELLKAIVSRTDPETEYFSVPQKLLYESDANYICLSGKSSSSSQAPVHRLLAKMQVAPHTLGQLFSVNQGIVTAADKISPKHLKKYALNANTGDGIFVLSDEEIDALRLTEADISILKPWFKNSDVHRWVTSVATDQKVIFADKRLGNLANAKVLMRHLQRFRAVLDDCSSNSPYIHRPRSIDFEGPKLVVPQRAMSNVFAYSSEPWYASADVYFITDPKANSDRLKSILSLLNSKLYFVWFYHKGKRKGEMLELYQTPLSEAPIPLIDKTVQKSLVAIVNRILAAKRKDIDADVTKPEREIDLLVYELYKLTPAEIELVEKAASPRSRRLEAITEEVR